MRTGRRHRQVRGHLVSHPVCSPAEIVGLATELTLEQKIAQLNVLSGAEVFAPRGEGTSAAPTRTQACCPRCVPTAGALVTRLGIGALVHNKDINGYRADPARLRGDLRAHATRGNASALLPSHGHQPRSALGPPRSPSRSSAVSHGPTRTWVCWRWASTSWATAHPGAASTLRSLSWGRRALTDEYAEPFRPSSTPTAEATGTTVPEVKVSRCVRQPSQGRRRSGRRPKCEGRKR
jgi:hypothetical protein